MPVRMDTTHRSTGMAFFSFLCRSKTQQQEFTLMLSEHKGAPAEEDGNED